MYVEVCCVWLTTKKKSNTRFEDLLFNRLVTLQDPSKSLIGQTVDKWTHTLTLCSIVKFSSCLFDIMKRLYTRTIVTWRFLRDWPIMQYVRKQREWGDKQDPCYVDCRNWSKNCYNIRHCQWQRKWKVKTQLPDLSMQYLSFVRMLGSSQSGRQVPVFESLATRHTLHSVGSGFLDELVWQPSIDVKIRYLNTKLFSQSVDITIPNKLLKWN